MKYNERKKTILDLLTAQPLLSREIANRLQIEWSLSRMTLIRLYRERLVSRKAIPTLGRAKGRMPFLYSITQKGIDRLEFYK